MPQIIYVSLVGPVMLMATLEWFLWLAAFCYCLVKAYKKSQRWSEKLLAVAIIVSFVIFR
jgi:chitin synthase